ncbi:TonB family protein [Luteimonas sp. MHLX1A]|uniref:TonB family protein n=1 Tax=Alterluteimonas muca TaxID=2878684 RepID=UPI001E5E2C13|nr:TonB family protein [Luteimonas sp. MHLX1A]MCD9046071.1 energy transducer TonB [Luteimonas sp. MHLX1A]
MKNSLLGFAGVLALGAATQAVVATERGAWSEQQVHTYAVQLDADGRVQEVVPVGAGGDALGAEFADRIGTWLFTTDSRSGHGQDSSVRTYLRLVVSPGANGPELVSVTTGPAPQRLTQPEYPVREQREGRQGAVVLKLNIGADGHVRTSEVDSVHGNVSRRMAAAARSAATEWRFSPELVDARPVEGTVLWPVCFLGAGSTATHCAWSGPEARLYSSKTVLPLDPVARPVTPLAFDAR